MYDYTLIMLFNLVFTSLPVAVLGIVSIEALAGLAASRADLSLLQQFDKDVSAETSLNVPQLYRRGILGLEWTRLKFYIFMLDGLYQSFISFFVPYMVYSLATTLSVTGHDFSVWEFGTTVAACAVTSANLFVGLHIRYWTWMVFVIIIASTLAFHVWIAIYSQFEVFTFQNELICELLLRFLRRGSSPLTGYTPHRRPLLDSRFLDIYRPLTSRLHRSQVSCCLSIARSSSLTLSLYRFAYKYIQSAYFPHDSDIVREMEVLGKTKTSLLDIEAQSKHEEQALFRGGPGSGGPPTPGPDGRDPRDRTFSNESSAPSTPYEDAHQGYTPTASPPGSLTPNQQQQFHQHQPQYQHQQPYGASIPTINIQGTTPRESFASHQTTGSDFDAFDDRWNYAQVPSATTLDLNGVSPLEQTRIQAKRQASDSSWRSAESHQSGYAM